LGYNPTLVTGCLTNADHPNQRHAWVTFHRDGEEYLFETVAKTPEGLLRPLNEVRAGYRPEIGVDACGESYAFAGYLLSVRDGVGVGYGW
jgi:hypothetical protein